MELTNS